MSTAYGIAAVTWVLKDLLEKELANSGVNIGGTVPVITLLPDQINVQNDTNVLNLFMYQATYNQGWRNVGQPVLNVNGDQVNNSPLGIDLHYLLTAYGEDALHADVLLGHGMQAFHETPVLARDYITAILASTPINGIGTSGLADQIEQIKVTPEILSIEDISKLWAAFQTPHFRPMGAYKATVLLIESRKSPKQALPVKGRNIYVIPIQPPVLEKVMSQETTGHPIVENQKILSGQVLVLKGKRLNNDNVETHITNNKNKVIKRAGDLTVTSEQISFDLTGDLLAGLHEVKVVHPVLMGSPPELHKGTSSNSEIFVLYPRILTSNYDAVSGNVILKVSPAVDEQQRIVLQLDEINNSNSRRSFSFKKQLAPLSPPGLTDDINIEIAGVPSGRYLVRLQVDGAESLLLNNAAGQYNSPTIDIP